MENIGNVKKSELWHQMVVDTCLLIEMSKAALHLFTFFTAAIIALTKGELKCHCSLLGIIKDKFYDPLATRATHFRLSVKKSVPSFKSWAPGFLPTNVLAGIKRSLGGCKMTNNSKWTFKSNCHCKLSFVVGQTRFLDNKQITVFPCKLRKKGHPEMQRNIGHRSAKGQTWSMVLALHW